MTREDTRNDTAEREPTRCCAPSARAGRETRQRPQGKPGCPCAADGGCPARARWICLAALIGGLGFLALRTARRGRACCTQRV